METILKLVAAGDHAGADKAIREHFQEVLNHGKFEDADKSIEGIDVGKLPPALLRSVLESTFGAKGHLHRRAEFYAKCVEVLTAERGEDYAVRTYGTVE